MDKTTKRGGARVGSGRKDESKVRINITVSPDVAEFLRAHQEPASKLINDAIRTFYMHDKIN